MVRFHTKVFDDIVPVGTSVVTSSRHDAELGRFDNLVFQAVATMLTDGALIWIWLEISSDGRTWWRKDSNFPIIILSTISTPTATEVSASAGDNSTMPNLEFVRLAIENIGVDARVRVFATARDGG